MHIPVHIMQILHVSAECYPYAKVGGLGDVVGALPKYLQLAGHDTKVVLPMYRTRFLYNNEWEEVHKGSFLLFDWTVEYTIIKEKNDQLGFELYCVDIFGLLDREQVYGYSDDAERFLAFSVAVADWVNTWATLPDVVHVHDHHTGLIPFIMQHCTPYARLASIPTILTIHNAQYQGWMDWDKGKYLPAWDSWKWGLLDWNKMINPLASGIKCASKVTTVSPGYLQEIRYQANGLEQLFNTEWQKCSGIINGIDTKIWDPATDTFLEHHYTFETVTAGKQKNKQQLCEQFNLDAVKPLFVFIGRLVGEKAADILPQAIVQSIFECGGNVSFLVLGSGDPLVERELEQLNSQFAGYYNARIAYNEALSHQMYAGADFLLMPSRVEPCGLNQLYAMRYGTMPVVRSTGGLKDTVVDIGDNGYGIRFDQPTVNDLVYSVSRCVQLYGQETVFHQKRKEMMQLDFSWQTSAEKYIALYEGLK
jgi:starch synthase